MRQRRRWWTTSCGRRITYAEYGETVETLARGLIAAGVKPGEVVAIFLFNSWEFCATFHATQLAGAIPTLLNPTYREREVRYQLENSGAVLLITDAGNIDGINLAGLPNLRRVYTTRTAAAAAEPFANLLKPVSASLPHTGIFFAADPCRSSLFQRHDRTSQGRHALALQPGRQYLSIARARMRPRSTPPTTLLCCLPLYHIYGLNVMLNPALVLGAKLVLMPRFHVQQAHEPHDR